MSNGYKYDEEAILQLLPLRRAEDGSPEEMGAFSPLVPVADHSEPAQPTLKPGNGKGNGHNIPTIYDGDKTADLVRIYLKDMGTYLLLSREEEIAQIGRAHV